MLAQKEERRAGLRRLGWEARWQRVRGPEAGPQGASLSQDLSHSTRLSSEVLPHWTRDTLRVRPKRVLRLGHWAGAGGERVHRSQSPRRSCPFHTKVEGEHS